MGDRRRDEDEDRGSRRSRDDDDRGSRRSRDDDRGSRSREREDDDRGSRSRGREDEDDRGSRGGSSYQYERRDAEATKERANRGGTDYDKFLKSGIKMFKPNDGDNRIRLLPPTWKKPKPDHYGYDIYVHYGVGADRQSYLCPRKMQDKPCPICEARDEVRKELNDNEGNKELEKLSKDLEAKRRVLSYLVDRDHEREGLQAYAMAWTVDRDIVQVMQDKRTGEVLPIDDPEDGYDVEFTKKGSKDRTEYSGIAIARRSSPLGNDKWLQAAVDNPLPDQLVYFDYDHIAKAFGGKGSMRRREDDDDRGRNEDRDQRRGREEPQREEGRSRDRGARDDDRGDDRRRSRDDDDDRGSRSRGRDSDEMTWERIHDMTKSELEDLIEQKDLDIKPKDAKDVEDLADWVCEEMKIKKPPKEEKRRARDDDEGEDKMAAMRKRRESAD